METPIAQPESPYEILRRLENIVRVGTIADVRHSAPARCRVRTGNLTTAWVPWLAQRAGGQHGHHWWPPVVGEQCLLLAPGGDLLNAVALPGLYSNAKPQGSADARVFRMDWNEADSMVHDAEMSELTIDCYGAITLKVQDSIVQISAKSIRLAAGGGELIVDENGVTAKPDVTAQGISLVKHVHTEVRRGGELSGEPA
ncbi:phage baseplate assembly protein V [Alicycliphilus denitrificans]|uniref:phage baseplate assembly protein V n=1 Tax=Alicycliphilus denitrificans TaxID=179636 RepID=UPI0001D9FEA1|nr:phage baseplate assembly protein V [Alicycliphilus denitrificans]ADU99032.1 phage baseplate assembly protein V [Alicycliphilus denitrificans BC]